MEKRIIVPIDFSDASRNAYQYALKLAERLNRTVEVMHVINHLPASKEISTVDYFKLMEEHLNDFITTDYLGSFMSGEVSAPAKAETTLVKGNAVMKIIERVKTLVDPIIVIGSTGSHNAIGRMFGSVSSKVAQQAGCPVMLIPKENAFKAFENILYALNFNSAHSSMVRPMIAFAKQFNAGVHFIQCQKEGQRMKYQPTEKLVQKIAFENGDPGIPVTVKTIVVDNVLEGLKNYAKEEKMDMIAIVNVEQGYLESFFGKSMSKKLAMHSELPVLVYHL